MPFRREHSYLSAADATQEALCQRWNSIWPHASEDSRRSRPEQFQFIVIGQRHIPKRQYHPLESLAGETGIPRRSILPRSNSRNTPIRSVLPQQHRIARLFKPSLLRLEGCPQSYPPFGSMCCNQTMSVSEMITAIFSVKAMRRSGAVCVIRRLIEPRTQRLLSRLGVLGFYLCVALPR